MDPRRQDPRRRLNRGRIHDEASTAAGSTTKPQPQHDPRRRLNRGRIHDEASTAAGSTTKPQPREHPRRRLNRSRTHGEGSTAAGSTTKAQPREHPRRRLNRGRIHGEGPKAASYDAQAAVRSAVHHRCPRLCGCTPHPTADTDHPASMAHGGASRGRTPGMGEGCEMARQPKEDPQKKMFIVRNGRDTFAKRAVG